MCLLDRRCDQARSALWSLHAMDVGVVTVRLQDDPYIGVSTVTHQTP